MEDERWYRHPLRWSRHSQLKLTPPILGSRGELMKELIISKSPFNPSLLDAQLRSGLGANFLGLSTRPGELSVFLADETSGEMLQQVQSLVATHDANALSPEQQAALERQQALEAARSANAEALDGSDF